jgi:hypothetical protein
MPQIKLDCPHCGQHLEADDELCGQRDNCPSCNGEIIIPAKAAPRPVAKVARVTASAPPPEAVAPSPDEEREVLALKPTAKAFLGEIILGILLLIPREQLAHCGRSNFVIEVVA